MIPTLISEEELRNKIQAIGNTIKQDYEGRNLVLITILKGSVIFMSDLCRYLNPITTEIDFLQVSSYEGSSSSGKVVVLSDITIDLKNKHAIIVEDILDTGLTLSFIIKHLKSKNPASLKVCTLLNKNKIQNINIDYNGFYIQDKFVVGYGLDFNEKYRNLPYIGYIGNNI